MALLPTDWKMGKCLEWYTQLPLCGRPQTSPVFMIQNVECYFYFCRSEKPRTDYNDSKNYYYFELYLKTKIENSQIKSFSFTIYTNYDAISSIQLTTHRCRFSSEKNYVFSFSERPFLSKAYGLSSGFLIGYLFVFQHDVVILLPSELKLSDEKSTQVDLMFSLKTDIEHLSSDFNALLKSGKHSDVQLLCNGGNIPAHKTILSARSKAFSDMFQDGTEESKNGLVNFTTTEISVMELCLEYTYEGKILNLPIEKASNLYILGHTLKISSLTKICADLMIANSSGDNYITYLVLAKKYSDNYFKNGLIDYISSNADLLKEETE